MLVLGLQVLAEGEAVLPAPQIVDTAALAAAISFFVPIVVSIFTKKEASDGVKAVVNILAVALATAVSLYVNAGDTTVTVQLALATFVAALLTSLGAYKGVYKPLLIAQKLADITKYFGFGKPVPAVAETARPGNGVL